MQNTLKAQFVTNCQFFFMFNWAAFQYTIFSTYNILTLCHNFSTFAVILSYRYIYIKCSFHILSMAFSLQKGSNFYT